MARAALIISGEMRRAYNCVQTAKNLSQICDVDVFLHTWNQITYSARQKDLKLNIREDNLTHESLISEIEPKAHLVPLLMESMAVGTPARSRTAPRYHEHSAIG